MIREKLSRDLKNAVKSQDNDRAATLRLICAAIKDRDHAARFGDNANGVSDAEIIGILIRMVQQRRESAADYEEAGQVNLAEQERDEIRIIQDLLPRQFSDGEVKAAIDDAISKTGAASIRDISKVMAHLKAEHTGRMDFTQACAKLKASFR
jgi:uncharacterized protein